MTDDRAYPVLDLFSGYGGFSLAFEAAGGRTIGFSEIDPYASAILAHRWPTVPNLGPVQHVTRDSVLAQCGVLPAVITGGFPCQPHSMAGKRGSVTDERDLWDDCWRILRDIRPKFALFENVGGLLTSASFAPDGELVGGLFFNRILSDLAAIRYACQWHVVSAADVNAPHKRERVWLLCVDELAYGHGVGRAHGQLGVHATEGRVDALGHVAASGDAGLADGDKPRLQRRTIRGGDCRDWAQSDDEHTGGRDSSGRAVWPAAAGLWPARPGEPQYGWEPSRVIGHEGRGLDDSVRGRYLASDGEVRAGRNGTLSASGGQAQPRVGRDVNGPTNGPHPASVQVREAEAGDAVNRVHRLKALGNGIIPAVAHIFALAIRDQLEAA